MSKEKNKISVKILINTYEFSLLAENKLHERSLKEAAKLMEDEISRFKDQNMSKEKLLLASCLGVLMKYVPKQIQNHQRLSPASYMILDMQNEIKKRI